MMEDAPIGYAEADTDGKRVKLHAAPHFEAMRRAGRLAAEALDMIGPHVRAGVSTGELDRICHDYIVARGAIPAPLGYRGFPSRSAPP